MKYTTVIFDLDDTLCNTSESKAKVFSQIYRDNSKLHVVSEEEFTVLITKERQRYLDRVGGMQTFARIEMWLGLVSKLKINLSVRELKTIIDDYWKYTLQEIQLFPDTLETLDELMTMDMVTVLVTGGDFYTKASKLIKLGIDNHFKYVFTADLIRQPKNDPAIYRYVLNYINVQAPRAIMVGNDPEQDIIPANQIGITTVQIFADDAGTSEQGDSSPSFKINNLHELIPVLEGQTGDRAK
ncbi:MAG: HAD family hydrolase [Patescibacteria group bacterium]|nr:HAD family hydrolase [Patescibacteria group bacterium]